MVRLLPGSNDNLANAAISLAPRCQISILFQCHMNGATICSIEGGRADRAAFLFCFFTEAQGKAYEVFDMPRAIPFRINENVRHVSGLSGAYFIQQVLQSLKRLSFFADENAAAISDDVKNNLVEVRCCFDMCRRVYVPDNTIKDNF
jgi:hypothetical protein